MSTLTRLARLGVKHASNSIREELLLRWGIDRSRPISVYGFVNEHCNARCRYCDYWRLRWYVDEMPIEQWQAALLGIKDFIGSYSISFSGGEPFLKPRFVDLLAFCHQHKIHSGATTNGSCFTPMIAERTVAARPFNINISVEAPSADIHDYLRGRAGLFDKVCRSIRYLVQEKKRQRVEFPIIIKPTINSANYRLLPDLVRWAEDVGASSVNFQALDLWTPETRDELWIPPDRYDELEGIVEQLLRMKRDGAPILNSEENLRLTVPHFRGDKAPPEAMPCRVGMRNLLIYPDGRVRFCFFFPDIGNVQTQSVRDIWTGSTGCSVRKDTTECQKLCLYTCLSNKKLRDKVEMGWQLLRKPDGGKN